MMFALKLLGLGKTLAGWAGAAARWLFGAWYRIAIAALIGLCLFQYFANADLRGERDDANRRLADAIIAHADFVQRTADAAKEAELRAMRNAERVRAEYAEQAKEASHENERLAADYSSRIAEFVRRQRASAYTGSPGPVDLPGSPALPGGPLPDAGPAFVSVPESDLGRCGVAFAQLSALISYVRGTERVDTVPAAAEESP